MRRPTDDKEPAEEMLDSVEEYRDEGKKVEFSDEDLVARAKEDPEVFGHLYDRYYPEISNYIYRRTWDHALTEDLTSNTFYAAFRNIHKFRWKRIPLGAWLFRIASNEIGMYFRKHGHLSVVSLQTESVGEWRMISSLPSSAVSVDDKIAVSEMGKCIHHALNMLKPKYQTVIALRFFEEKSIEEIAVITGKRKGTVRSQLHRGLKQLRAILIDSGEEWGERGDHG